jgi:hypothetical protein
VLALVFTGVAFVALVIAGLGVVSLLTDQDVIATEGLGPAPAAIGIVLTALVYAGALWAPLARSHPSYWNALWVALACYLAYLAGVGIGAALGGADPAVAAGVAGRIAIGWFGLVVAAAALASAWSAIALVRTRAGTPRWPWEGDEA